MAITLTAEDKRQRALWQAQVADMNAVTRDKLDPASPNYIGPGYVLSGTDRDGNLTYRKSDDPAAQNAQMDFEGRADQAPTLPAAADVLAPPAAPAPAKTYAELLAAAGPSSAPRGALLPAATSRATARAEAVAPGPYSGFSDLPNAATGAPAGLPAAPPRAEVSEASKGLLTGLNAAIAQLNQLAQDSTGLSEAEALANKNAILADQRAANELRNSQAGALGAARSSRNRGDTALLERAAVGEQAYLGDEAQRQDVLRQQVLDADVAALRARETDADRQFRLNALKAAGDLGINTAALEVDLSKANLAAASDYVSNQFQMAGINAQIDQQQAEALLGFARDMESLKFQYAQLSQQEQLAIVDATLQKYGIDKNADLQRWVTKQQGKPDWLGFAGGLLGAGIGAGATLATKSDRRAKTNIQGDPEREMAELLEAVKSYSFDYKRPEHDGHGRNLGVMAQDLQKTTVGDSMVSKGPDGELTVDNGRAGLAALSGLALVYDRLKQLEESV